MAQLLVAEYAPLGVMTAGVVAFGLVTSRYRPRRCRCPAHRLWCSSRRYRRWMLSRTRGDVHAVGCLSDDTAEDVAVDAHLAAVRAVEPYRAGDAAAAVHVARYRGIARAVHAGRPVGVAADDAAGYRGTLDDDAVCPDTEPPMNDEPYPMPETAAPPVPQIPWAPLALPPEIVPPEVVTAPPVPRTISGPLPAVAVFTPPVSVRCNAA